MPFLTGSDTGYRIPDAGGTIQQKTLHGRSARLLIAHGARRKKRKFISSLLTGARVLINGESEKGETRWGVRESNAHGRSNRPTMTISARGAR